MINQLKVSSLFILPLVSLFLSFFNTSTLLLPLLTGVTLTPQNGVVHPWSGLWDYSEKTDPQTERAQPEMCGPGGVRTHHPHQEKCQQGNQERLKKRRSQKNSPFLHFHALPPTQLSTFINQPRPLRHTHNVCLECVHVTRPKFCFIMSLTFSYPMWIQ